MNIRFILAILILGLSPFIVTAGSLHQAVLANDLQKIEHLLKKGENANEINEEGSWPLLIAATYGFADASKILISEGANVNQANKHGYTALHEAAGMGYIKVVKILVKNKADINKADINNYSALKYAQTSGTPMVVRYLKRHGAQQ